MRNNIYKGKSIIRILPACLTMLFLVGLSYGLKNDSVMTHASVSSESLAKIEAGDEHTLGLSSNGSLYAWGNNSKGQLGDGTIIEKDYPMKIDKFFVLEEGEKFSDISAGKNFSIAVTTLGNVYSWGINDQAQLGLNTADQNAHSNPSKLTISGLSIGEKITKLASGQMFTLAVTSNGNLFSWGNNGYGQLGDGTTTIRKVATKITISTLESGETIAKVAAGTQHSIALTSNGAVYTWGNYAYGRLGILGATANQKIPYRLDQTYFGSSPVTCISAGDIHSGAVTSAGSAYGWGNDGAGRIGDGDTTTSNKTTPVLSSFTTLSEGETIVSVSCGILSNMFLTSDGNVYTCGANNYGMLADGTYNNRITTKKVVFSSLEDGEKISTISVGFSYHNLVVTTLGNVFTWGRNNFGQLGNGLNGGGVSTKTSFDLTTPTLSKVSSDDIFAINLFEYKTCTEFEQAYAALIADYDGLTLTQKNRLSSITYNDYPNLTYPYDYATSTKTVATTATEKWNYVCSLYNAAHPTSHPLGLELNQDNIGLMLIVFCSFAGISLLSFIKMKKKNA